MTETFHTRDGARIGYQWLGRQHKGPALIMVNGMSAIMGDWLPLAEALATTRPVILLDHRGIGASYLTEDQTEEITIELMAQDVIDLLCSLNLRIVHLLGFSMGGMIVQAIITHADAHATPDRRGVIVQGIEVRRVVLTATFARTPRTEFNLEDVPRPTRGSRTDRAIAAARYLLELQYHTDVLGTGGALQPALDARLAASLTSRGCDALRHVPRGLPIAVIHGRRDRMVAYEESEDLLQRLPGAERLFPDTQAPNRDAFGHMWFDYFALPAWVTPLGHFLDRPGAKM